MADFKNLDILDCAVCSKNNSSLCSNCFKVSYCSPEHSQMDLIQHKKDCFPARIEKDEIKGRFLVATRPIKRGELILHELPLTTGPNPTISQQRMPLCLSCYKQVKSGNLCTRCKWPVCDTKCEKLVQHSEFECPIFASRGVPAPESPSIYFFVNVLRCYLLQEIDPSKWEQLFNMECHEQRLKQLHRQNLLKFVFGKFKAILETPLEEAHLISHIVGALEINAHGLSDDEEITGFNRDGQFLFHKLSLLSHDCAPNATWIRVNEENPPGTFSANLLANVEIKKGEVISIRYTNKMENTFERRKYLKDGYLFDCTCKRCSDPTEMDTFYSALKCPINKCDGHLLPVTSTMPIFYKCNKCDCTRACEYLATLMLETLLPEYGAMQFDPLEENLKKLEEFIKVHEKLTLHPNNHMLLNAKENMIVMMEKMPNRSEEFQHKHIQLCKSVLHVNDRIFPGITYERSKILRFLFNAQFKLLLTSISKGGGEKGNTGVMIQDENMFLVDMVSIGEEALEIYKFLSNGKVASEIQSKLKWLAKTYSFLTEICNIDDSDPPGVVVGPSH